MNKWTNENFKLKNFISKLEIPNNELYGVEYVELKNSLDFNKFPKSGGCYWIWTNEPIKHFFHKNKNPNNFDGGEIIYNGITQDINGRIKKHLSNKDIQDGYSAISIDLYLGPPPPSHFKKAMVSEKNRKQKIAFIKDNKNNFLSIETKENLEHINLSDVEKKFVENSTYNIICFRNGINIFDEKHETNKFRVYFLTEIEPIYYEFIEKEWRKNGLPRLCTYKSGR